LRRRERRAARGMNEGSATPQLMRRMNERTVLEAIRLSAPISRAEISRRVGISKPTVSLARQSLLDAGLVRESGAGRLGRRAGGALWRGGGEGVDDCVFLSVGTGRGAGRVLRGELHRGRRGAAGEVDFAVAGDGADPSGVALSAYAASLVEAGDHPDTTIGP